ncbi:PstS family phosphate ABC transporter substrate-binding protein [Nitrospira sp. CMX1]|nr:substrate-binding domain-containing protein [Nitrospira sp.]
MNRFLRVFTLECALLSAFHLFYFVERSSAEHSDPLATVTASSTLAHYSPKRLVSGAFKVQSSEALFPLLTRLSADFQRFQPKVTIEIKKGTSKAVTEFLQPPLRKTGKIMMIDDRSSSFQLLAATHQLSDAEIKEFVTQHGYEPMAMPVAVDAVALYVHKDNPLPGLTLDQVDAIFSSTRKRGAKNDISQWGHLGLAEDWEAAPIRLYGRDRRSEARAMFLEHALAGGEFKSSVQEHPGVASVALNINHNPMGIGYSALGLHTANVRTVPVAEKDGMPFVLPTRETVADQTYPLRHALYLYFDQSPKTSLPESVQEFLTFIMSQEGEETVMRAGLFPLSHVQAENRTSSIIALPYSPS